MSDPVDEYAAALSAALHGPARVKARLVEEIRDGLADAVADHAGAGLTSREAAELAVREFGTVEELVPSCQRELTIGQTRATARMVAVAVPVLIVCWLAVWSGRELPEAAQVLAAIGVTAVLAAGLTLITTGALARRLPMPPLLPLVAAWTGTTASVAMPLATVVLAIAAPAAGWPLVLPAALLTVVSHGVVAASARACRHCARLPVGQPSAS
ncbi:permease prefix domain 1-containing protein [Amycolatopsis magusensis]|uniref:DUF1700 domain-containing protein n=1 Tax=Amycolatopsis magusensis TaxID=882444 RepID=A0ABS4PPP6_9PSEU|nr:permease prefix domain 1-containing protein [Amycolatopsis magusensis]MBP2181380.1 hypothetical protein [Amycolatopsis magusensis]MDI5980331.1 permease prefix domain 1-containing protein [Amycolatopsis magusensis]